MIQLEEVEGKVAYICNQVLEKRDGQDEPFDEYLREVIIECHKSKIQRSDADLLLQERFGDDQDFTEFFKSCWDELELETKGLVSLEEDEKSALHSTPKISSSVFSLLPNLLQRGTEVLLDPRQKDLFLISSLSTLSSVIDGVKGIYSGDIVRLTQFVFIVAPAASGKAAMKYSMQLVEAIHLLKREQSESRWQEYQRLKREFDRKVKKAKEDPGDPPEEPLMETLFIPGNSSTASMLHLLAANQGGGLIAETEADSLTNSFGSEWGDFSDILRKAFQHEPIRLSRRGNNEFKEVLSPKFSVCLTGTPAQVLKLIASAEDGLFSRVNFYAFASELKWIDPSPANHVTNYAEHYGGLSQTVLSMYHFFKEDRFEFEMNQSHWLMHKDYFSDQLKIASTIHGSSVSSVIYRLGLTCYRIAMVLSCIEHFEANNSSSKIICSDKAFNAALSISKVLLAHAELMFRNLPKSSDSIFNSPDPHELFFNELPAQFDRADAIRIGKECKVGKDRTIDGILKRWLRTKRLSKPDHGVYSK